MLRTADTAAKTTTRAPITAAAGTTTAAVAGTTIVSALKQFHGRVFHGAVTAARATRCLSEGRSAQ